MSSGESGPYETTTQLSRELLRQAYPDQTDTWINEKAENSVRSIEAAASQQFQPPRNAVSSRRRPSDARRLLRWGIAAAFVVAGVVVFVQSKWITTALAQEGSLFTVAMTAVLALGTTIWMRIRERYEKVLSCRIRLDTPFGGQFDAGEALELTGPDATAIPDSGMVVVRVKNLSDAVIEPEDYIEPLRLHFPDRRVLTVDVTESEPPELQKIVAKHSEFRAEAHSIALPSIRLTPDDSYYVVAFLSGTKVGTHYTVPVEGRIRRGWITTESTIPWIRRRTIAAGAVALASGVLVVALLLNNVRPFASFPEGLVCVSGSLTVEGSSAFAPAAKLAGTEYHAYCPGANIDVRPSSTKAGLNRLHDASEDQRANRLALSDGRETLGFTELKGRSVAVVPFTFVVNESVPVTGLSLDQARTIFTGKVSKWNEISGNSYPADVRVVIRADDSGTQLTLQQQVLNTPGASRPQADSTSDDCVNPRQGASRTVPAIVCERATTSDVLNRIAAVPDAIGYADMGDVARTPGVKPVDLAGLRADLNGIQNGYPFWTVEYVYSYGELADGSLAKAFTDHLARYLLRIQTEAQNSQPQKQSDYFACGANGIRELCARNDR